MGLTADAEIEMTGDDTKDETSLFGKFVQLRASKNAMSALGTQNVERELSKEAAKERIAHLRSLHSNTIKVRVTDNKRGFYGLRGDQVDKIKGEDSDEPDQIQLKEEEPYDKPNKVGSDGITLSVFHSKNTTKKDFLTDYYHTASEKRFPVKSRNELYDFCNEDDGKQMQLKAKLKRDISPPKLMASKPESFPFKTINHQSLKLTKLGNIRGLHLDED